MHKPLGGVPKQAGSILNADNISALDETKDLNKMDLSLELKSYMENNFSVEARGTIGDYIKEARELLPTETDGEITAIAFALLVTYLLERKKDPNETLILFNKSSSISREIEFLGVPGV